MTRIAAARRYGGAAGIPEMYLDHLIAMGEVWDALPRLDATFDSQEGASAVVVEILRGGVTPVEEGAEDGR